MFDAKKRTKMQETFGLALSRPNTGSLLQAPSGKAEKPVHRWPPDLGQGILRKKIPRKNRYVKSEIPIRLPRSERTFSLKGALSPSESRNPMT